VIYTCIDLEVDYLSTESIRWSNTDLAKHESHKGAADLFQDAEGNCHGRRLNGDQPIGNRSGISMFLPVSESKDAFVYAHQRLNESGELRCMVTTSRAMSSIGLEVWHDRVILDTDRETPRALHLSVYPREPEVTAKMETIAAGTAPQFALCKFAAAANPVDLPDTFDTTADAAVILLESVLDRETIPASQRFESAIAQYVLASLDHSQIIASISSDVQLSWLFTQNDISSSMGVATDDAIKDILLASNNTIQNVSAPPATYAEMATMRPQTTPPHVAVTQQIFVFADLTWIKPVPQRSNDAKPFELKECSLDALVALGTPNAKTSSRNIRSHRYVVFFLAAFWLLARAIGEANTRYLYRVHRLGMMPSAVASCLRLRRLSKL